MLRGCPRATIEKDGSTRRNLRVRAAFLFLLIHFLLFPVPPALAGKIWNIAPGNGNFARTLTAAAPGDRLVLETGDHLGAIIVDKSVIIEGRGKARILGKGQGHVLDLAAPNIVLRGLEITGSGLKLESEDSGIFVREEAAGTVIENNHLVDNLIGVYLKGAMNVLVRDNRIEGRQDLRVNERGNGIQIWNSPGAVIEENTIRFGRDGIFVTTSKKNVFRNNEMRDLRFAVHYMYTNHSELLGNRSYGNHVGFAIMYSKVLKLVENLSQGDRDYGFLLNYTNSSTLAANRVTGGHTAAGPEKCVFIYNANKNTFEENLFRDCNIGIHFTAGSERNLLSGNAFLNNRTQVKYVGTRQIEWSREGRGNFWSDSLAFDLNDDGIADAPYHPNDLVDQIIWRHPLAKLLLNAPATQVLRWSQRAFPNLRTGGVVDSHPLMVPPGAESLSSDEARAS